MTPRGTWLGLVLAALAVAGCGVQGDGSLRPVPAVTIARLPKDHRPPAADGEGYAGGPPLVTKGRGGAVRRAGAGFEPGGGDAVELGTVLADKADRDEGLMNTETSQVVGQTRPDLAKILPTLPQASTATEMAERRPVGEPVLAEAEAEAAGPRAPDVAARYRQNCGSCHSLDLVEHQRLDRDGWDWVLDDMIETYKATWIHPKLREELLDYLVERLGPEVPRDAPPAAPVAPPPIAAPADVPPAR